MTSRAPVGVVVVVAGLVGGILAGEAAGAATAGGVLVGAAVVAGCAVLAPGARSRVACAALACSLLGVAVMQRALHGLTSSPFTAAVTTRETISLRGRLVDDPSGSRFTTRVLVRVDDFRVDGRAPSVRSGGGGRRLLVVASGDAEARLRLLSAGDGVSLAGRLGPLEGFDSSWRWRHAVAELHATDVLAFSAPVSPLARIANAARTLVLAGADRLAPADRALLAGFLLGDTRGIPTVVTDHFRAAGLTHLLAVSGENVAFVLALFAPVLRRLGLRGRLVGGVAILVLFGTMTRWQPSVLRAITMAGLALLAGYLGRPTAGLRVLALAALVLLVADPFLVHSVGFLLSCGASLGIALLAKPIERRLRGPVWTRETLAVTAAAQLGVAPVLLPVFGSIPLVALPANLVAVPLAAPLTMWGLATGVLGGALSRRVPQVAALLQRPTSLLLHALVAVADVASRVPFAIDGTSVWLFVALGCVVAAAVRARRLRRDASPLPAR